MDKEIYYVGFPGMMMGTHQTPIPFELVEESDRYLRIRLLEDEPLIEGFEDLGSSTAGTEFVISATYNSAGENVKLLDILREGKVAPFYLCEENPPIEKFAGTMFGYNPNE